MKQKLPVQFYYVISGILAVVIIWMVGDYMVQKNAKPGIDIAHLQEVDKTGSKLFDPERSSFVKEEVTVTTEVITDGLRNIGKLITQEYFVTQVESYEKEVSAGPFSSKASVIYSYDAVVKAGVDCDDIAVNKDEEKKTITITIPKASIQDVTIDLESFKLYEEKQGLWSKIKISDVNKSLIEFKNGARDKAEEKGILESADENAELVIDRFVKSLTDLGEYTIQYKHK